MSRKNGTPQPPPGEPPGGKLLDLFKPPSALSKLSPKSRAQIEGASHEQLCELVALEVVRRVEAETAANNMHVELQGSRESTRQCAQLIGRVMAHYARDAMLAPDGRYASLEIIMPVDDRQLRVPADFEIVTNQQPDAHNPLAQVIVVRLVRPDVQAAGSGLVDAGGKPVGGGSNG